MSEIDITKKEAEQEDLNIELLLPEDKSTASDGKSILIMVAVIVGIFLLLFGGSYLYNNITAATPVSVDDLHQQNLDDKLDEEEGYVYNGYSFIKTDGLWWTEMNKFGTIFKVPLHFSPRELEDVKIKGELDPRFGDGDGIFITIDPKVSDKYYALAVSELSFNTVQGLDRIPIGSCIEEHWACENRTIISCDNTLGQSVIEFAYGEKEPSIELSGRCIKLNGQEYALTKAVDRLLYQWYGIMD